MDSDFHNWVDHLAWMAEVASSYCKQGDEPRALAKLRQLQEQLDAMMEEYGAEATS